MESSSDDREDIEMSTGLRINQNRKRVKFKKNKFSETKRLVKESDATKKHNYICQKRRNTLIISMDDDGNPILSIGPDWYFYAILSTIITGGFLFLFIKFYQFVPLYLFISGFITYLLFIVVYTILFLSNPGYPERVDLNLVRKSKRNFMYCSECNIWVGKNSGIKHCHRCGMCIEKYDHHCDWISKCVGKGNINYFYFFIIWIVMVIIYFIAAFVIVHEKWFEYQRYLRNIEKMKNNQNP